MDNKHPDYDYEARHLDEVCKMIAAEIEKKEKEIHNHKSELVSIRKNMWENARHGFGSNETEAMIEATQYIHAMKNEEKGYSFTKALLEKYRRLILSPYFARVDFNAEGDGRGEKIYIGIYSFIDMEKMDVVVHDWRAPVSTIFYEYELGEAQYGTKEGVVHGSVLLKRQFKIRNSELLLMFDSSVKIDDEILQEILSGNASDRMKNIVTTIQKEQNRAIRYDEGNVLIVQGAAGSGKTSIALHRVAYLLYKDRNIMSDNIIIFSPSQIFNDYISNVLPELGEKNTQQTTFAEYAAKFVNRGFKAESLNEHMESVLSNEGSYFREIRWKGYGYKTSMVFLKALREYVKDYTGNADFLEDIWYDGRLIIPKEELQSTYIRGAGELSVDNRLKAARERALYLLSKVREQKKGEYRKKAEDASANSKEASAMARMGLQRDLKSVKDAIFDRIRMDIDEVYVGFYKSSYFEKAGLDFGLTKAELDEIRDYTVENFMHRLQNFEDAMVLFYLKCQMQEIPDASGIRHVVIDEAQDYSPLQYEILKKLFPQSSFTILGDLNQTINPYGHIEDYASITDIFGIADRAVLRLKKSYRSTKEITDFTRSLLSADIETEGINRKGELPEVKRLEGDIDAREMLLKDIGGCKSSGMKSVAIICKTADCCRHVHKLLKNDVKMNLVTKDEDILKEGITILPSYLCKGLEFDGVLVYDASEESYPGEKSAKLLYTICTRALHRLIIYYSGKLSSVIENADESLYKKQL